MILSLVSNRYPNNTNPNNINLTTANRKNAADFKKLKEYSVKKIEEKLDLLKFKSNIQNPTGWLRAALNNDYQDLEEASQPTPHPHLNPPEN